MLIHALLLDMSDFIVDDDKSDSDSDKDHDELDELAYSEAEEEGKSAHKKLLKGLMKKTEGKSLKDVVTPVMDEV